MEVIIAIAILAVIVAVLWIKLKKKPAQTDEFPLPDHFPFIYQTLKGVQVYSVVEVPLDSLSAIDEGIEEQITRIDRAKPDWTQYKSHLDYKVMFVNPMTTNISHGIEGSPALIVKGIQTAGTCLGVGSDDSSQPIIVLPHQQATNWQFRDYLVTSTWYESEHIREWVNDPPTFYGFLGASDIHPHFN